MKLIFIIFYFLFMIFAYVSCGGGGSGSGGTEPVQSLSTEQYIAFISKENGIDYERVTNAVAYIPPMCWVTTIADQSKPCYQCHLQQGNQAQNIPAYYNPCYTCHTVGKEPNYLDDSPLQMGYAFPNGYTRNPWTNLFRDRSQDIIRITDEEILKYIKQDNYLGQDGEIILRKQLPIDWPGYRPDCYFNFDSEGFDINPKTKEYTGWRAFRYYPFPGAFFPTNGFMDDALIRLPEEFRVDRDGRFNKEIYKANLAIVEAMTKQRDILIEPIDERVISYDLDKDGTLGIATKVKYTWITDKNSISYVGKAGELLKQGKFKLAGGLYPVGTEFLHSVRYVDWDESKNEPVLSKRIKELRYGKKVWWADYNFLDAFYSKKGRELVEFFGEMLPESFVGNYKTGMETGHGWVYQGFIEDRIGTLRPQTNEETLFCMGCHSFLGATTDSTFAFPRKLESSDPKDAHFGWGHWSQRGLKGIKEPVVEYKTNFMSGAPIGKQNEYAFYLRWTKSSDDFRTNEEVIEKFFDNLGFRKRDMIALLKDDISILLYPSKQRVMNLNKAYWSIVKEQSFIKGREAIVKPVPELNLHRDVEVDALTGIPYRTY